MLKVFFYKPTKYKQTSIGQVPEGWEAEEVKDVFIVKNGTTPSTKVNDYWEDGNINWITPEDLSKINGQKRFFESRRKITETALDQTRVNLLNPGDIILSTRAPVGYVAVLTKKATFNQGCRGLVAKQKEKINSFFFAYLFDFYNKKLQDLSGGSTFKELSKSVLESVKLQAPPLPEQKKISEVLSKIDETIEVVKESIEKWQRIKKAAMRQLLTRGIGHKKFKYVEGFGEVPEKWEVTELGKFFNFVRGYSYRSNDIASSSTKKRLITINNFEKEGGFNFAKGEMYINANAEIDQKFKIQLYDLLVANTDMGKGAIIGAPIYIEEVSDNFDLFFSMDLTRLVLKTEFQKKIYNKKFIYYLLTLPQTRLLSKSFAQGTNVLHLNHDLFRKIRIAFPLDKKEQDSIVSILQKIDQVIETKQQKKKHLEKAKKEMMKLLLTGKVRIKV